MRVETNRWNCCVGGTWGYMFEPWSVFMDTLPVYFVCVRCLICVFVR